MSVTMKRNLKSATLAILCLVFFLGVRETRTHAASGINVTTYHNDNARTGQNLNETTLNTSNVNVNTFGQLFKIPVDGYVFAEPLYVSNVTVSGQGTHNLLFIVTEHDSAFAFDADTGQQLWTISFIDQAKGITTLSSQNDLGGCPDISPEVGITGTPVIDPVFLTAYLVVNTKENGVFFQRLHALNLTTGTEIAGSPVVIQATVAGTGEGSVNGQVSFDPLKNNQRSALMLQNGAVEIQWASHCDIQNYHGWVMAYDEKTLKQLAFWSSTPNGGLGGIWQGGAGPAADSSHNTYFGELSS